MCNNINISEQKINKIPKDLNPSKSSGPEKLHPRVLKEISTSKTKPFFEICNSSIQMGNLPDDWKKGYFPYIKTEIRIK